MGGGTTRTSAMTQAGSGSIRVRRTTRHAKIGKEARVITTTASVRTMAKELRLARRVARWPGWKGRQCPADPASEGRR